MDCSLPASSVHGILQARLLEWVAIAFSRGSSWPRDRTHVFCIGRRVLYTEPPEKSAQCVIVCKDAKSISWRLSWFLKGSGSSHSFPQRMLKLLLKGLNDMKFRVMCRLHSVYEFPTLCSYKSAHDLGAAEVIWPCLCLWVRWGVPLSNAPLLGLGISRHHTLEMWEDLGCMFITGAFLFLIKFLVWVQGRCWSQFLFCQHYVTSLWNWRWGWFSNPMWVTQELLP